MHSHEPGVEVKAWVNTLPFGAPEDVIEDGYDYTAYCAKPFVLAAARNDGADIAILADASFYAIRSIQPLIRHIAQVGYYLCNNGYKVGEWSSDRCLSRMGIEREKTWNMREVSSYCVGLNFADGRCTELLHRWCGYASDRLTIPGPHTNSYGRHEGRNKGFVSHSHLVAGHRHDQTVLSVLAARLDMQNLLCRPVYTAYRGSETQDTVLVNHGGL
jgi:hypothetical protein